MSYTVEKLEVSGLCHRQGQRFVLHNLYFEAQKGQITGIFGRNGSGKTTLYRLLTDHRLSQGSIHIDGSYLDPKLRSRYFAFLPQAPFLPKDLRVRSIFAKLKAVEGLDHSCIEDWGMKFFGLLSYGQKRYLELNFVLGLKKPIVLLDEPFHNVDPITVKKMQRLIINQSPTSIILLSDHNLHDSSSLATKHLVLSNGALTATQPDTIMLHL